MHDGCTKERHCRRWASIGTGPTGVEDTLCRYLSIGESTVFIALENVCMDCISALHYMTRRATSR